MHRRGHYKPGISPDKWRKGLHTGFGYNVEGLKILLDELCRETGVEIRFLTRVIDAEENGRRVTGVVLNSV